METDLIRMAMHGDAEAFEQLGRPRFNALFRIAERILRNPHDAEDATQQALWEAWRDIRSLRDLDHFDAWLHRLVVNACYRLARSQRKHRANVVLIHDVDRSSEVDLAAGQADRDSLARAFATLSMEHRAAVVLHYYNGYEPRELAKVLGVAEGTVRSRLHYARRHLRAELEAGGRTMEGVR
jgi:RNA polymerase sigma factor (sigma-70 family)